MCDVTTNITAVTVVAPEEPKSRVINLRMSRCTFAVKTSDKHTRVFYFHNTFQVSWKLWKTEFQINSYHTMSNNTNFTKNVDKIIWIDPQQTFHGTISETQYASGNG